MKVKPRALSILQKLRVSFMTRTNLFMNNYEKAEQQIALEIAKAPDNLDLLQIAQRVYRDSQNWDAYISVNENIERLFPDNISFKLGFGTTLIAKHRYEDAVPRLLYCIENWNLDASYVGNLINVHARLAICYGYLQKWELLKTTLQAAQNLSPEHLDPDITYAHVLYYQGTKNVREIPGFLDEQINRDPDLYALYYWKGRYIQEALNDVQESIELYKAALRKLTYTDIHISQRRYFFAPQQYAASWYILKSYVDVCMQLDKQQDAFRQIRSSRIKRIVTSTDVQVLLVYMDILNKSLDVAEDKCRRTLVKKISMDAQTEYWLLLTLVQMERGNFDEALTSISQVLALDSEKLEAWKTLGLIQMKTQTWNQAIQTFQILIGKDYFDFQCWEYLGRCYMHVGDHSSARDSYEQAVNLNPLNGDALIDLAQIYVQLGETDLATAALQDVLKQKVLDNDKRQQAIQMLERLM